MTNFHRTRNLFKSSRDIISETPPNSPNPLITTIRNLHCRLRHREIAIGHSQRRFPQRTDRFIAACAINRALNEISGDILAAALYDSNQAGYVPQLDQEINQRIRRIDQSRRNILARLRVENATNTILQDQYVPLINPDLQDPVTHVLSDICSIKNNLLLQSTSRESHDFAKQQEQLYQDLRRSFEGSLEKLHQIDRYQTILHEQETRFRGILEHISSGVLVVNSDNGHNRVLECNCAAERLEGSLRQQMYGLEVGQIWDYAEVSGLKKAIAEVAANGGYREILYSKQDGSKPDLARRFFIVPGQDGQVAVVYDDLTTEQVLLQRSAELTHNLLGIIEVFKSITASLDLAEISGKILENSQKLGAEAASILLKVGDNLMFLDAFPAELKPILQQQQILWMMNYTDCLKKEEIFFCLTKGWSIDIIGV